jgi:hypothetical protein
MSATAAAFASTSERKISCTLSLAELLPVRVARGREGDWRDWQAVDDWAAGIAHELNSERSAIDNP